MAGRMAISLILSKAVMCSHGSGYEDPNYNKETHFWIYIVTSHANPY
jgi:hypothetical protein